MSLLFAFFAPLFMNLFINFEERDRRVLGDEDLSGLPPYTPQVEDSRSLSPSKEKQEEARDLTD